MLLEVAIQKNLNKFVKYRLKIHERQLLSNNYTLIIYEFMHMSGAIF